ncbi:hypothetical protein J3R82DRAFT_4223 [Butyriboletus roseoflavus]|nr:hypothetical protein J3R82DRAFT_4223 [Butyriboletus roseoflavus]
MALIALWNLPAEFETICRDLWVLHLDLVPSPPPAEPFHYTREQEGLQRGPEQIGRRDRCQSRPENDGDIHPPKSAVPVPDTDCSSSEDELLAPEIAVLLEENSEVSSSDDGSSGGEPRARNNMHTPSKNPFVSRADRPENTIAVLVLACWTIRLPVVYMDFINAIESHSLPYLDHVRFFPPSLTCHLTKHAVQALSPHYAPKTLSLHRLASRLANRFYDTFDIVIPELNSAPVLWRVVQECLCGTPMLYVLTKSVGNVLSLGLSLQGSSVLSLSSTRRRDTDSQKHDNPPPEISLVATAIVVLKLVYGLDGKQRLPRSSDDAACAFPAVTEFLAAVKAADHAESCVNSHRFGSQVSLSVGDLDDSDLDDYLDFCQKVLIDPKRDEHRVVENYFPLTNGTADLTPGKQPCLRGRGLSSTKKNDGDTGILEPGDMYTIYDAKDVLGNLCGDLGMVVEKSARWAGTDCDFVCGVVERYERRLVRWWHGQKGREFSPHRSFLHDHHHMRRLASVFVASSRRSDKSDAPSTDDTSHTGPTRVVQKKSRVFPSLSRKHLSSADPPSLPPLIASDLANSSSSSSSGSTTLRTPDDDGIPRTPSKKGSWKSWLAGRNAAISDHPEEHHPPPWKSSQNALRPPKPASNETDDASSQFDDSYGSPDDIHTLSSSPQQITTARANARIMIMNSLVHELASPPLFQLSGTISFPRSCNKPRRLRRRETLESELHKKSLLARLDRLSPSAESSIAPLASKPLSPKPETQPNLQVDVFPSADSVSFHSTGLENWVLRPCFEDRLQLWFHSDSGEIIRTRIPGSHFGVAALEFSESLELMAGALPERDEDVVAFDPALEFTLPPLALNLDPPAIQTKELELEPLSPPSNMPQSKDSPAQLYPSPQRSFALPTAPSPTQQPHGPTTSGSATTNDPVPKRGVRFADDDGKDDQIPLGYVLRIRKNKEQKARFLREERERRERAAQLPMENGRATAPPQENRVSRVVAPRRRSPRPLISLTEPSKSQQPATVSHVVREEERLRREVERIEMEKLRRSRELARKQAEERERAYAGELQATRARREASRAGRPLESASLSSRVSDRTHSVSRDSMLASPQRSSMSHKYTPELVLSPVSPYEGSPSSSVPATPGSQNSFSRPPSLYSAHTASSEDVRGREGRRGSRRMSVVSDSTKGISLHPSYDPRASFYPYAWTTTPPVPQMPAIPTVNGLPFYGVDMPLLPPTPPFMMNQYGARPRSYIGLAGQHSPLQSSSSLPRNYSPEGANSSSRNSSPHSSGSHQRRSSNDTNRMAKTPGDPRSGSYNDVRGSKTSVSMRVAPSQRSPQRSSWLPPEQSPTTTSSFGPVYGGYSSAAPAHVRRRTAAS